MYRHVKEDIQKLISDWLTLNTDGSGDISKDYHPHLRHMAKMGWFVDHFRFSPVVEAINTATYGYMLPRVCGKSYSLDEIITQVADYGIKRTLSFKEGYAKATFIWFNDDKLLILIDEALPISKIRINEPTRGVEVNIPLVIRLATPLNLNSV